MLSCAGFPNCRKPDVRLQLACANGTVMSQFVPPSALFLPIAGVFSLALGLTFFCWGRQQGNSFRQPAAAPGVFALGAVAPVMFDLQNVHPAVGLQVMAAKIIVIAEEREAFSLPKEAAVFFQQAFYPVFFKVLFASENRSTFIRSGTGKRHGRIKGSCRAEHLGISQQQGEGSPAGFAEAHQQPS